MGTAEFPVSHIHSIAQVSCAAWIAVNILAHIVTRGLWRGYRQLTWQQQVAWTNRIASATHALLLLAGQAANLRDPVLLADPLHAVTDSHFFWGSVMFGYLAYDTAWTLVFYRIGGSPSFLLHHAMGLAACVFGLYYNKMALYGMAIQVFFESTTPLLHLLGCLKLAGKSDSRLYVCAGLALMAQFAVCRVAMGAYYWAHMVGAILALPAVPAWAAAGVVLFGALCTLNTIWLAKMVAIARVRICKTGKMASTGQGSAADTACSHGAESAAGTRSGANAKSTTGGGSVIHLTAAAAAATAAAATALAACVPQLPQPLAEVEQPSAAAPSPPCIAQASNASEADKSGGQSRPRLTRSPGLLRRKLRSSIAAVMPSLKRHGMNGPLNSEPQRRLRGASAGVPAGAARQGATPQAHAARPADAPDAATSGGKQQQHIHAADAPPRSFKRPGSAMRRKCDCPFCADSEDVGICRGIRTAACVSEADLPDKSAQLLARHTFHLTASAC